MHEGKSAMTAVQPRDPIAHGPNVGPPLGVGVKPEESVGGAIGKGHGHQRTQSESTDLMRGGLTRSAGVGAAAAALVGLASLFNGSSLLTSGIRAGVMGAVMTGALYASLKLSD